MVATVKAIEYSTGKAVLTAFEEWDTLRPGRPIALGELVDFVTGLLAEEPAEVLGTRGKEMNPEDAGLQSNTESMILLGEAEEVPRWIEAGLSGEPHQAATELLVRAGRDDQHRIVELGNDLVESALGPDIHLRQDLILRGFLHESSGTPAKHGKAHGRIR